MTKEDIKHIVHAIKNYRQVNVSWFTKDDDFIAEQLETRFIDKPDLVITTSSAPEGLDEAAYKYSFESRPSVYGQVDVIDAFKAGAEWMAGQGVIVNGVISRDDLIYDLYTPELDDVLDASWEDKNVIVQIRKK